SNGETLLNSQGESGDWIELFNPEDRPVNMAGYFISDDIAEPAGWQIPKSEEIMIPAKGYLILWADDSLEYGPLHLPFKLAKEGEEIILTAPDGRTMIDRVEFPAQERDISYGRISDGGKKWQFYLQPTPASPNNSPGYPTLKLASIYSFYSNNKVFVVGVSLLFIMFTIVSISLLITIIRLRKSEKKQKKVSGQIRELAREYETIINNTQDALFLINVKDGAIFVYNRINFAYVELTGFSLEEIQGKTPRKVYGPDLGTYIEDNYSLCVQKKETISYEEVLETKAGQKVFHTKLTPVRTGERVLQIVGSSRDVTERKVMEKRLAQSEKEYRDLFEESPIGLAKINREGKILDINKEMEALFSAPDGEKEAEFNLLKKRENKIYRDIQEVFEKKKPLSGEEVVSLPWGEDLWLNYSIKPFFNELDQVREVIMACQDITEKRKAEERAEYLTFHDTLTGIYNRNYFNEELKRYNTPRQLPLSIIIGDVNGLKLTNDAFGHQQGDKLLQKVAEILKHTCRQEDLVARWGGDEFVILLPRTGAKEANEVCDRLKEAFAKTERKPISPSIALGFACKEDANEDIQKVFKNAEDSMYQQKIIESKYFYQKTIDKLQAILKEKSPAFKERHELVKKLALQLGEEIELPSTERENLATTAELYELGKTSLPKESLAGDKDGGEAKPEDFMRYPERGYQITVCSPQINNDVAEAILSHQENWDGSGYPRGLKSKEIPLNARIINIVDHYIRLVAAGTDKREALEMIKDEAGIKFDPSLIPPLERVILDKE
ncbi:MAG: diguanylate cyclase, partial [Halanaerobium sp.]|nr:diguanylate cyclase [Halanaerobium sp.]